MDRIADLRLLVEISVTDGTVTLEGSVDAYYERDLIESAARRTEGVRAVVDNLRVF
jgi:osmotically-inducible protein OsmY